VLLVVVPVIGSRLQSSALLLLGAQGCLGDCVAPAIVPRAW